MTSLACPWINVILWPGRISSLTSWPLSRDVECTLCPEEDCQKLFPVPWLDWRTIEADR
jgi:hypothetical protein